MTPGASIPGAEVRPITKAWAHEPEAGYGITNAWRSEGGLGLSGERSSLRSRTVERGLSRGESRKRWAGDVEGALRSDAGEREPHA